VLADIRDSDPAHIRRAAFVTELIPASQSVHRSDIRLFYPPCMLSLCVLVLCLRSLSSISSALPFVLSADILYVMRSE